MQCKAAIYFDRAPFIKVDCSRPYGHDGAHEVVRQVYSEPSTEANSWPHGGRASAYVAFTWTTDVGGDE